MASDSLAGQDAGADAGPRLGLTYRQGRRLVRSIRLPRRRPVNRVVSRASQSVSQSDSAKPACHPPWVCVSALKMERCLDLELKGKRGRKLCRRRRRRRRRRRSAAAMAASLGLGLSSILFALWQEGGERDQGTVQGTFMQGGRAFFATQGRADADAAQPAAHQSNPGLGP
jgi:hypothetical protein